MRHGHGAVWDLHVYRVYPKTIDSFIKPETHGAIINSLSSLLVLPVEVRLLLGEQVQVVLASVLIVLPRRPREVAPPVGRRQAGTVLCIPGRLPDIPSPSGQPSIGTEANPNHSPVTLCVVLGRPRFFEPGVLVRCMIDNEIQNQLHAPGHPLVNMTVTNECLRKMCRYLLWQASMRSSTSLTEPYGGYTFS